MSILFANTLLEKSIQYKTVFKPSQPEYMKLQEDYHQSLSCQCRSISMSYLTFIKLQPHYHQLCSSDLVSKEWITYIQRSAKAQSIVHFLDYRSAADNHFNALSMFCQEAQQIINDTLRVFLQTQFVSSNVISQQSFEVQVNSLIEDWKSTTVNTFMRTIQLIRATTQGNQLSSAKRNSELIINSKSRRTTIKARQYSGCNCALSPLCRSIVGIYKYDEHLDEHTQTYLVRNFFAGCYPVDALLASTLQYFYNLSYMLEIDSYLSSPVRFNFSALNPSLNLPNETIEQIVNRLMVDRWSSNISYTSYYNTCAPLLCTHQYEHRNTLLFAINTVANIYGGLSFGLSIIILIGLKFIDKIITSGFSCVTLLHSVKQLFICNTEDQRIHRLHFILVVVILYAICFFYTFSPYTTTVEIKTPSLSIYKDLVAQYNNTLRCHCSQISINYKAFLNITPRFHQVCSSDFVSDEWIRYRHGTVDPVDHYSSTDFYYSASGQFQLLASFCELSQETVNNSLLQLGTSDFINTQLLSSSLLDDHIRVTIDEFQLTMPNLFVSILSLIRETTTANKLISVLSTSWVVATPPNITKGWAVHMEPLDYQGCSCALSSKCVSPSRRMLSGCYPLESILQSTLECLYDQQCIDSTNMFKAMSISSLISSRFPINTTVESIVNKLMVEDFLSNMSYESYFNQCAPLSCTYSYMNNDNIIKGITIAIGVYGGLMIICQLFALFIVKQIQCATQRVTPITE